MVTVLWLFVVQGTLGALDTLYYHEWRARLPALGPQAAAELRLHAFRDFIYCILFVTLPWFAWQGFWAAVLCVLLLAEIIITLTDFVVEDSVRKPLGGVYKGERVMHAIMGIIYGATLANFLPVISDWWVRAPGLVSQAVCIPEALRWLLVLMGLGVGLSGVRDLCASYGIPGAAWPWQKT